MAYRNEAKAQDRFGGYGMTGLLMTGFVTENISMGTGFAHFDRRNASNLNSDSGMRDKKRKELHVTDVAQSTL